MIRQLARLPLRRFARSRMAWLSVASWSCVAVASAWWWHRSGTSAPAGRALLSAYATLSVPLLCSALAAAVARGGSLLSAANVLSGFGARSRQVALVHLGVAAGGAAGLCALLACVVVAVAHGPGDPPVWRDLFTSAWVGALAGGAFCSLFCAGSCFGKRGGGRNFLLVASWIGGAGALGSLLPAAHLRSLLGGGAVGDLGQRASALALALIGCVSALVVAYRARDRN